MILHYLQVLLGFVIAQLLMASLTVYKYQKEKNISYGTAWRTYMYAELGFFIIGICSIAAILFVMSDYIDLSVNRKDLLSKESLTWKENLQLYFKTSAFIIGAFVQYIAFIFRDKGKVAIDKVADKL